MLAVTAKLVSGEQTIHISEGEKDNSLESEVSKDVKQASVENGKSEEVCDRLPEENANVEREEASTDARLVPISADDKIAVPGLCEDAVILRVQRPNGDSVKNSAVEGSSTLSCRQESKHEKFRITYEARQAVLNYCSTLSEKPLPPKGIVLPGLLVVPGVHARLSNISEDGLWIESETFNVGNKEVRHIKGNSVGATLQGYRRARAKHPDLFTKISVMAQPASNVDSVIFCWAQAELGLEGLARAVITYRFCSCV